MGGGRTSRIRFRSRPIIWRNRLRSENVTHRSALLNLGPEFWHVIRNKLVEISASMEGRFQVLPFLLSCKTTINNTVKGRLEHQRTWKVAASSSKKYQNSNDLPMQKEVSASVLRITCQRSTLILFRSAYFSSSPPLCPVPCFPFPVSGCCSQFPFPFSIFSPFLATFFLLCSFFWSFYAPPLLDDCCLLSKSKAFYF